MVKRKYDNNQHHISTNDVDVVFVNYNDHCRKSVRLLSIVEEKERQSKIYKHDDKVLLSSSLINKENKKRFKSNKKKKKKTLTTTTTTTTTTIAKYKTIHQNYYRQPLTRNNFTDDDIQYCSCNNITGCGVNCENRLLYM